MTMYRQCDVGWGLHGHGLHGLHHPRHHCRTGSVVARILLLIKVIGCTTSPHCALAPQPLEHSEQKRM